MPSFSGLLTALLLASSAVASPLSRRAAAGNQTLITALKTATQVARTTSLLQDEPDFSNFKFNFLAGLVPGPIGETHHIPAFIGLVGMQC
jgi:hypothetical protein